ncbi:mechanosensitive ion channel family protein [Acidovorax sp.]|jgi:small-conductance mechanosensitive channel|uniref:mechanosensitive ion channel family protein n=1 Tax=Acidovorax sp. TaxID=1872122 RepID=UPI00391F51ED
MATTGLHALKTYLPTWVQDWLEVIVPGLQILLIIFVAWMLQRLLRRLVARAAAHYQLPDELLVPIKGLIRWILVASAFLLVLERMGVSATVLWTALTGFATVGAVAFFAAWSVLSNLFCALLIFTVRPFRVGDYIEVLDTAEKPGAKGRVVDINLLYTTLEDHHHAGPEGTWLQIPNALIFQRVVRRWRGPPPAEAAAPAPPAVAAAVQESPLTTTAP